MNLKTMLVIVKVGKQISQWLIKIVKDGTKKKTGKKRLNKEDAHIIANDAAEHFLKLLCDEYRASGDM